MLPRLILLLTLLPCLFCHAAAADELTAAKVGDIRRLMDVTGSAGIASQFASAISRQTFQAMKTARPEFPDRALAIMDRELMALFTERFSAQGGLMDQLVPIYGKYFTHQEIRELLAFYDTPVGRKAILVLPKVVNESMIAGQRWGQSLGPEIDKRVSAALKREGLLPRGQ